MTDEPNENGAATRVVRRGRILGLTGELEERPAMLGTVDVLVRELTGKQARDFEQAIARGADSPLGFLLQMCIVDPDTHELLFELADRGALEQLGIRTLKPIIEIAQELSGITDADVAKARESLGRGPSTA